MDIKKLSKVLSVVLVVITVGGILLAAIMGIKAYYDHKELLDSLTQNNVQVDTSSK